MSSDSNAPTDIASWSPWFNQAEWAPFKLDALGIITLLGGVEISQAIGDLVFNVWTEFLPLFGAYSVPSNDFIQPIPGFTLYNLTDAITSTTFSGWFSRWLLQQESEDDNPNAAIYIWTVTHRPRPKRPNFFIALAIGVFINSILLGTSLTLGDWYGFATSISFVVSIIVRWYLLRANKLAIDRAAKNEEKLRHNNHPAVCLCLLPDNRLITVVAPRHVIIDCFLKQPVISSRTSYHVARAWGIFAFAVLVVALGSATLIMQLLIIVIMTVSTFITAKGWGSSPNHVGSHLMVAKLAHRYPVKRRLQLYAELDLDEAAESSMGDWNLVPHKRNEAWWEEYRKAKESVRRRTRRGDGLNENALAAEYDKFCKQTGSQEVEVKA